MDSRTKKELVLSIISLITISVCIVFILILVNSSKDSNSNEVVDSSSTVNEVVINSVYTDGNTDIKEIKLLNRDDILINIRNSSNGINLYIKNNTDYNISVRAISDDNYSNSDIGLIAGYCESKNESISKLNIPNIENNSSIFNFYIRDNDTNSDIYKTGKIMLKYENNQLISYSTSELIPLTLDTLEESAEKNEDNTNVSSSYNEELVQSEENKSTISIESSDLIIAETEESSEKSSTVESETIGVYVDDYISKIGLDSCGYIYLNKETVQISENSWETSDKVKINFMIGIDKSPSMIIGGISNLLKESGYTEEQIQVKEIYCNEINDTENGKYTDEMYEITLINDSLVNIFYVFNYGCKPSDSVVIEIAFPGEYTSNQIAEFIREVLRNYRLY